jgi:hypothetical protein
MKIEISIIWDSQPSASKVFYFQLFGEHFVKDISSCLISVRNSGLCNDAKLLIERKMVPSYGRIFKNFRRQNLKNGKMAQNKRRCIF